uniref:Uncharacterized protein n=1 Tax=Cucumis melo TaxID=3656 RepID=A0A9I9DPP7_CUCME
MERKKKLSSSREHNRPTPSKAFSRRQVTSQPQRTTRPLQLRRKTTKPPLLVGQSCHIKFDGVRVQETPRSGVLACAPPFTDVTPNPRIWQ